MTETHMIHIESACPEDLSHIYNLTNELEGTILPRPAFETIFQQILCSKQDHLFVLRTSEIVGYIHIKLTPHLHHAALIAEIQELVIHSGYRNQHFGAKLLQYALCFAKEHGAVQAELTSNFSRSDAHRFYEKHGFSRTSYKFIYPLVGTSIRSVDAERSTP